ncbi:hypothetical protein GSI_13319 [Ganoderma sinense ZZ0214-1]|uniref:Uncharacterized protein n=1 Tax=Ganoderma sinense ZZ0214-1 TaxID=1077348 RepID=A0A2G8RVA6_9APHY|nr:hypothetical protein GSI_13319 [Ganoderma sinense ZZ0214-1]
MARASTRLVGFSTPQPPRSKYSQEVRTLCLTGASDRKPYDSGTPQARNCSQCGGARTVIEWLAFREGRAGEWYRCCTRCRNINFPPQPGTPPELVERIEAARGRSSCLSSASSRRHRVRGASAPEIGSSRHAGPSSILPASLLDGSEASTVISGARIKKRRLEQVDPPKIKALNVAGLSKDSRTLDHLAEGPRTQALKQRHDTVRGLAGLAKKPHTLEVLMKEFLELSQEMGVPIGMPSAPSLNRAAPEQGAEQGHETETESTMDTPTPAPRKRKLNILVPPRVKVAPARVSTSVHIPLPRSFVIKPQVTHEVIEISSGSEDEGGDAPTPAQQASRDSSVISLTDSESEDISSASEDEGLAPCKGKRSIRRIVRTPSDVIELTDSEQSCGEGNRNKENTTSSGLDVSTLTRTHHGLLAACSPTCLTDLLPSDSSPSENTDLFAEDVADNDPYVPRNTSHKSNHSDRQSADSAISHTRRSAAPQLSSPVDDFGFVPFGDIYRFEIYPSLANLAGGPLPVFNQATQWMLNVKIWYDITTKMITLDERRCEIVLATYHIVRRIFDSTQIYEFKVWNFATTDWRVHALTSPLEVSVDAGYHILLIRLPFVTSLTAWPQLISQAYGPCTTVERPARKGKERAID